MWIHAGQKEALNLDEGEIILVNKPVDWTSFDIVARFRGMYHIRKIGHTGTLDPKATGLLILCTGKMTKQIDQFIGFDKEYTGIIELGSTTKSFDCETEIVETKDFSNINESQVKDVIRSFLGHQLQLPPMYSAVKLNGRRLYKDARKGREITRAPREILIKEFEMTSFNLPFVGFRIVCSKGTYIRSLANDIGDRLKCGGYLKQLTRTRVGEFHLDDALPVEQLHTLQQKLLPKAVAI